MKQTTYELTLCLKKCVSAGICFAILALITIFWAGNSTYYTNLKRHHTLTYPLTAEYPEKPINVVAVGSAFKEENHFENLFISLFSEMSDIRHYDKEYSPPKLKIPFCIRSLKEIKQLVSESSSISGFGVFFSGVLVISIFAILVKLFLMQKNWKFYFLFFSFVLNCALCFAVTASHMARYAPYIYFIMLMGSYIILDSNVICDKLKYVFAFLVMINSLSFILGMYPTMLYTYETQKTLEEIKKSNSNIHIDTNLSGLYFNLHDNGISYTIKENLTNSEKATLFFPHKMKRVNWNFSDD